MWILEHEGALFEGKKRWLRPGTRHLLGRTTRKADDPYHSHYIDQKSVSRKHLLITVGEVPEQEWGDIEACSAVEIADDSKFGTTVDGERFTKTTRFLNKKEHIIKLGNWDQMFRLYWNPIVFSFSMLGKKKGGSDPLTPFRNRLGPLDVKTTKHYERRKTTHVVAEKRNTPEGLQALVNGKWIVTQDYIAALEEVATPTPIEASPAGEMLPSKLEDDFEAHWPKEFQYLPPVGREPVPRPAEQFAPDEQRSSVFYGYLFIFCDDLQYAKLRPAIEDGSGKAKLYELTPGETSVDEFVRYVRNIAGEEGMGERESHSLSRRPIVVRSVGRKGDEEWATDFHREVQLQLDQRSIDQSDFLDAIITKDASKLRRELLLEEVPSAKATQPRSAASQSTQQPASEEPSAHASESTQPPAETIEAPLRRKPRRAVTESRFKGFDDFDPSQIPKSVMRDSDDEAMDDVQNSIEESQMSGHTSAMTQQPESVSRKRPPPDHEMNQDNMVDQLAPAAAAMKRRRIAEGKDRQSPPATTESSQPPKGKAAKTLEKIHKAHKAKAKDIDVREALRVEQEAREEAERREAEAQDDDLAPDEIKALRNLAIVEEMEIKPRTDGPARHQEKENDRWDPKWNGRKNFKRFRRQGTANAMRGQRVLVSLEEAKKKDYGIGDEYWLEPSASTNPPASSAASTARPKSTQDPSQSHHHTIDETPQDAHDSHLDHSFRPTRRATRRTGREESIIVEESSHPADADDDIVIPSSVQGDSPEQTRAKPERASAARQGRSQNIVSETQTTAASTRKKRSAVEVPATAESVAKKPRGRPARATQREEDDDDGEHAFRFRRRRG